MIDLAALPTTPGIYLYRDVSGHIIYVGKAVNLKKRISQYFQRDDALGPKTATLVSQIASIETKTVGSEIEALILEASYIKKYRPKYNSLLKDDRSYQYICITREKFPRVFPVFQSTADSQNYLYGPFPSGLAVRSLLKTIRQIFPYYGLKKHPKTLCLYCHLHLCPGPTPDPVDYRHNISQIKKILSGKFKTLTRQLKKEMLSASKASHFELALLRRQQLESINYVVSGWSHLSHLYTTTEVPEDRSSRATNELLSTLQPYFPRLQSINRIECFDISQLGKKYFVSSMTVWQNGHLDHQAYRQFKITSKDSPDDQFMIKETVYRRLRHSEWGSPDIIVVDGGKPQVAAASSLSNLPPALIGLAKKQETIVIRHQDEWVEINLPANSSGLRLLQSLRDEAHRFANRYRKKLIDQSIR